MSGTQSTAGAVPVFNKKGEMSMQKVKVQRYVSGRRPDYAEGPEDEESDSDDELKARLTSTIKKEGSDGTKHPEMLPLIIGGSGTARDGADEEAGELNDTPIPEEAIRSDRRLQRLMNRTKITEEEETGRRIAEPEIISFGTEKAGASSRRQRVRHEETQGSDDEGKGDAGEDDEDNVARRHEMIRKLKQEEEDELLDRADNDEEGDEEDESEYEEYDDSEDESVPRLKPVFVRKDDRVTVKEREIEEKKEREREERSMQEAEERRMESLKIIEDEVKREEREKADRAEDAALAAAIDAIHTDDEDDQDTCYEIWKLRELKRIKREKDEREAQMKEEEEKGRMRNMTEEERQSELEKNPKIVTNAAEKGKYKFMQKYYHRGAFYLDEEQDVFKRNVAEPTLEDHFDKTILPKVMQVKNFGRSGRTKYTHLVDQDTTAHDGPWAAETLQTQKFVTTQGGGFKPVFERPSKRRKT